MELLLLSMLLTYMAVAPDKLTLGATRGAAGAGRAAVARRSAGRGAGAGGGRKPGGGSRGRAGGGVGRGAAPRTGRGAKSTSTQPRTTREPLHRSLTSGWRSGVDRARTKRANGKDAWSLMRKGATRAKPAVGAAGRRLSPRPVLIPKPTPGGKAGPRNGSTGKTASGTTTGTQPAPLSAPDVTPRSGTAPDTKPRPATGSEPGPAPAGTEPQPTTPDGHTLKEHPPMGQIQTTELENVSQYINELNSAIAATEGASIYLEGMREWGSSFAERNSGKGWSTTGTDQTAAAVTEATAKLPQIAELLEVLVAAREEAVKAQSVGEVAATVGAKGDVDAFAPA